MIRRNTAYIACLLLLLSGLLMAAEWWEKKPYLQWSAGDVKRMLDNSPWGKVHAVTIMNPTVTGQSSFSGIGTGDIEREKRNLFHLRFLTAKPIRMAIARQMMLADKDQAKAAALDRFVRQRNEDELIVIMSLSSVPEGASSVRGYWAALMKLSTPDLASNTILATGSGKRVYIKRYEPPGQDGLGAKFVFPRFLEDGQPVAVAEDREIRFETTITLVEFGRLSGEPGENEYERTDRIWMQFDLRKMLFEGTLEI